jgi:hypothetical protein
MTLDPALEAFLEDYRALVARHGMEMHATGAGMEVTAHGPSFSNLGTTLCRNVRTTLFNETDRTEKPTRLFRRRVEDTVVLATVDGQQYEVGPRGTRDVPEGIV